MAESTNIPKEPFFKGLRAEFKKISWPSKKSVAKETAASLIVSIILGVIIVILDNIFKYGFELFITQV